MVKRLIDQFQTGFLCMTIRWRIRGAISHLIGDMLLELGLSANKLRLRAHSYHPTLCTY